MKQDYKSKPVLNIHLLAKAITADFFDTKEQSFSVICLIPSNLPAELY